MLYALVAVPGLARIRICIEPDMVEAVKRVPGGSGEKGVAVDFVASAATITERAYASADGVEGPIVLTQCADGVNHECLLDTHCRVKPHMGIVGNAVRGALGAVTLRELAQ